MGAQSKKMRWSRSYELKNLEKIMDGLDFVELGNIVCISDFTIFLEDAPRVRFVCVYVWAFIF